jgi:hypothetical protein
MNIHSFVDIDRFEEHLTEILENDRPAWDKADEYHLKTIDVYFIDFKTGGYIKVDIKSTIGQILHNERYSNRHCSP